MGSIQPWHLRVLAGIAAAVIVIVAGRSRLPLKATMRALESLAWGRQSGWPSEAIKTAHMAR
jgi:hypothetical protein